MLKEDNIETCASLFKKIKIKPILEIKSSKINFNKRNTELFEEVVFSRNCEKVATLKFVDCKFSENFIHIPNKLKEKRNNLTTVGFVNLDNNQIALYKNFKENFESVFATEVDYETRQKKSKKENSGSFSIPYSPERLLMINNAPTHAQEYLKKMIPMRPGWPGEILAEAMSIPYVGPTYEEVKRNLTTIGNSWLIGYPEVVNSLVDFFLNYGMYKGTGAAKPIVYYGPPGIGKTTLCHTAAAMARYIDTKDLKKSLFNPKNRDQYIRPWLVIIVGSGLTTRENILGIEKGFKDAQPGVFVTAMVSSDPMVFTKVIVLDEIDKIPTSKDNIIDVFLEILGSETQRSNFHDNHLGPTVSIDLTKVPIFATANNIS
ncbi:MAG: AAA family ATPase, partial [Bacteroidota bacterium]